MRTAFHAQPPPAAVLHLRCACIAVTQLQFLINQRWVHRSFGCGVKLLWPAGDAFWNLVSITPVQDTAGKVMSFIGVHSDITELVRRREAEKELQEAKVPACVDSLCVLPMLTAFVYYLSCLLRPCLH